MESNAKSKPLPLRRERGVSRYLTYSMVYSTSVIELSFTL